MAKRDKSQGFGFSFPEREVTFVKKDPVKPEPEKLDLRDSIEVAMEEAFLALEETDEAHAKVLEWLIDDLLALRGKK